MENASKALLIAGAILIAILLIAIGMMVFNSASGVVDTAASGMSDQEKTMHNRKFTQYEGNKSPAAIKALIDQIETNNNNPDNYRITQLYIVKISENNKAIYGGKDDASKDKKVEDYYGQIRSAMDGTLSGFSYKSSYKVTCYDAGRDGSNADGLISRIELGY